MTKCRRHSGGGISGILDFLTPTKQPTSSSIEITTSYDMGEGGEVFVILRQISSLNRAPKKIVR